MFYSSDVSDVCLQSIFKLNDEKSYKYYNKRSQLMIMVMFNIMIKKKVN